MRIFDYVYFFVLIQQKKQVFPSVPASSSPPLTAYCTVSKNVSLMCVLPYLRHLVPEKKKSFTFSHFPFRTSTDHCCSRKRSPLTYYYYCTSLLYNKFMYACILFTFSRRHARVYCLSVKRGAFISCEQLLLLLFFFCFFVFHKACGTIDLQALLRKGARLFRFKSQYCMWFFPSFSCVGDFCKRAVASHSALNQAMC